MSELVSPAVRQMDGAAALPRENGELVFREPWEGRVFGAAIGLVQRLDLDWERFRRHLVAAIDDDPDRDYYESWVRALESLAVEEGVLDADEVDRRATEGWTDAADR